MSLAVSPMLPYALAVALVAAPPSTGQAAAGAAKEPAVDPTVARCVLDHIRYGGAFIDEKFLLQMCQAVVHQPSDNAYVVRCRINGDPSWIEFRLLTREQCARANGSTD